MKNFEAGNAARPIPPSERPGAKRKNPDIRLVTRPVDLTADAIEEPEDITNDAEVAFEDSGLELIEDRSKLSKKNRSLPQPKKRTYVNQEDEAAPRPTQEQMAAYEAKNSQDLEAYRALVQEKQASIAQIEERIAHLKAGTERAKMEKERIELESALNLAKMDFEAKEREENLSMQHAADSHFAGERAHAEGAEFGRAVQGIREAEYANELSIDEEGNITGLKNVPSISPEVLYRAMGPAMNKINEQILAASKELKGSARNRRLAELETEANMWFDMEKKAQEEKGPIRNEFYLPIDVVLPDGLSKSEAETLSIESEKDLDQRIESLKAQDAELTKLVEEASEVLWNLDDSKEWGPARQKIALSKFLKAADAYLPIRNEGIDRELEVLRKLDQPENLDVRSQRLTMLARQAEDDTSSLRGMLGKTDKKSKGGQLRDNASLQKAIDKMEGQASEYKNDLMSWRQDPLREEAMQARHEDLQEDMTALEHERNQRDRIMPFYVDTTTDFLNNKNAEITTRSWGKNEVRGREKIHKAAEQAEIPYRAFIEGMQDRLHGLLREKAKNADELAAILLEKEARKGIDVDVSDLIDESVDVDVSAHDEDSFNVDVSAHNLDLPTPRFHKPEKIQTPGFSRSSEATRAQRLTKPTPPRFTTKPGSSVDKAA
jgi:hypothetical protein